MRLKNTFLILCLTSISFSQSAKNPNGKQLSHQEIQEELHVGTKPFSLLSQGVSADDLYGKEYQGGLIVFLDIQDKYKGVNGLVCSKHDLLPFDQTLTYTWGCYGTDIVALENVRFTDYEYINKKRNKKDLMSENQPGSRILDGVQNTRAIIKECPTIKTAARGCKQLGEEWFLPSRGTLYYIYKNVHLRGYGDFSEAYYWSSTEYDATFAWMQNFGKGEVEYLEDGGHKNDQNVKLRAVKVF